jgi:DNA-binding MarR family transcriptional regulator
VDPDWHFVQLVGQLEKGQVGRLTPRSRDPRVLHVREPDPTDRRALQIVITDSGVELLRRMWPIYARGIDRHFVAQLGRSTARLRAVLERVAASAGDDRE